MTSLPANDMTLPVKFAKALGTQKATNFQGDVKQAATLRADRHSKACEVSRHGEMDAASEQAGSENDLVSFDKLVESLGDVVAEVSPDPAAAASTATQVSVMPPDLAAIFQRVAIEGNNRAVSGEEQAKSARLVTIEGPAIAVPNDVAQLGVDDADSLDPRALEVKVADAIDPAQNENAARAPEKVLIADATKMAVSVQQVQRATSFDAPISVTANQQSWFQSVSPALSKAQAASMRDVQPIDAKSAADSKSVAQRFGSGIPISGLDRMPETISPNIKGQGSDQSGSNAANDRPAQGDPKSERSAAAMKGLSGVSVIDQVTPATAVATPYQQIRAAVADALTGASAAQQTDYVSLYADRPSSSGLSLKTLELSLAPPDLGRVNVKMNLTARDLTLEIDASKASTAKILTDDQAALRRDLMSDALDLSSVLVSITSSVSDASASSATSNGDQQTPGGSRSPSQDASTSMAGGGRDERKPSHNPTFSDAGKSREQVDVEPGVRSRERNADALYI